MASGVLRPCRKYRRACHTEQQTNVQVKLQGQICNSGTMHAIHSLCLLKRPLRAHCSQDL